MAKIENAGAGATEAKLELRRWALAEMLDRPGAAHVFDAFCGSEGAMWRGVWKKATSYVGCDLTWTMGEERRRFVGDNRRVMRAIDLSVFNVFDFDAFGTPWEQLVILAARRRWEPNERGAVIITDGSRQSLRLGGVPHGIADLLGMPGEAYGHASSQASDALQELALKAWANRSGVVLERYRFAEGEGSGKGAPKKMLYLAATFVGRASRGAESATPRARQPRSKGR